MMTPIHGFYLRVDTVGQPAGVGYGVGYWLHTALLAGLFGAGAVLFAADWNGGEPVRYPRWYAGLGALAALAVVGSNGLAPAGVSVAPLVATSLTTVGWLQAKRWSGLEALRDGLDPGPLAEPRPTSVLNVAAVALCRSVTVSVSWNCDGRTRRNTGSRRSAAGTDTPPEADSTSRGRRAADVCRSLSRDSEQRRPTTRVRPSRRGPRRTRCRPSACGAGRGCRCPPRRTAV